MDIGIGLPTTIRGVEGRVVTDWARQAEAAGFSSLGVIDRLVYLNDDPLIALAAAGAVTERVRLTTSILIAPCRSPALLAKAAASVHHLSGGRLVLGMAIGNKPEDYEAAGAAYNGRGRRFAQQLQEMKRIWGGEERGFAGPIGPPVDDDHPTIIVGGHVNAAFERAARYADGWIMGGAPPELYPAALEKLEEAWKQAGRREPPRKMAITYFALGAQAHEDADRYAHDYYAFAGDFADHMAAGVATGEEAVKQRITTYEQAGCDELILFPCSANLEQLELLAGAAL